MLINKNWIDTMPSELHGMVYGIVPVGVCGEWLTHVHMRQRAHAARLATKTKHREARSTTHTECVCVKSFCFRTPLLYYIFIQKIGVCCYFKAQNKVFTLSVAPTRQSTWGSSQKSCSLCVYGCVRHFCEWNLPTYSCFLSVLGFWWVHEPGTRWCWGGPHEDQEQKAAG